MSDRQKAEITRVLAGIRAGTSDLDALLPLVYDELRRVARGHMRGERPGQTLQPTALVHEAFLKLVGQDGSDFVNRRYFFAAAGEAMRRILIDTARRKAALRHGGDRQRQALDDLPIEFTVPEQTDIETLNASLERLEALDERKAAVVKLRLLMGLSVDEVSEALAISITTVKSDWMYAKAWMKRDAAQHDAS